MSVETDKSGKPGTNTQKFFIDIAAFRGIMNVDKGKRQEEIKQ